MASVKVVLLFASLCGLAYGQTPRPQAGISIDEVRQLRLLSAMPSPCVSVDMGKATIVISRSDLEQMASEAGKAWKTEEERMAFIAAKRAEAILGQVSSSMDGIGCAPVSTPAPDALYLLADQLESGKAALAYGPGGRLLPEIAVRYLGQRCGPRCGRGEIMFLLNKGGELLFTMPWWVS